MIILKDKITIDSHGTVWGSIRAYDDVAKKALIPNQSRIGTITYENGCKKVLDYGCYKIGHYQTPTGVEGYGAYVDDGERQLPLTSGLLTCTIIGA